MQLNCGEGRTLPGTLDKEVVVRGEGGGGFLALMEVFFSVFSQSAWTLSPLSPSLFRFDLSEIFSMALLCSARHSCASAPVSLLREN